MKRKKKKRKLDKYKGLCKKIKKNTCKLWNGLNTSKITLNTNSWFNIEENVSKNKNNPITDNNKYNKFPTKIVKCNKLKLHVSNRQKIILLHWMDLYNRMYNITLKFFKQRRLNKESIITNFRTIRTKYLKNTKDKIIKNSQLSQYTYNTKIYSHVLDQSIKDACGAYKSCLSNFKNGNIKFFRLRYLKNTKSNKILTIEKMLISKNKNTFCSGVFNEEFKFDGNFKLQDVGGDFKIHYNKTTDSFTLLNPIKIKPVEEYKNINTVSLDPGIRSFLTGFSNNKTINIGSNLIEKLLLYINRIDKMNKYNKNSLKYRRRIQHIINDMHWKVINYLTKSFDNILIGNLSTKRISLNDSNNYLEKKIKRIGLHMRLFIFKERLQYKCDVNKKKYKEIDEAYTSKTCSSCTYFNKDLGSNKQFICKDCDYKISRDINGARNIMLLNM